MSIYTNEKYLIEDIHDKKKPFQSEECPKASLEQDTLSTPGIQMHGTGDMFPCKVYKNEFDSLSQSEKSFKCDQCSKSFQSSKSLSYHLRQEHKKDGKFSCDLCGKTFIIQSKLKVHMVNHVNKRNFKCHDCNKEFKTEMNLNTHISRKHATDKPFQCEKCSQSFAAVTFLRQHAIIHDEKKPFQCVECRKSFKRHSALYTHKIQLHGTGDVVPCGVCGMEFTSIFQFEKHMVKHRNEKNFKCDLCDKSYREKQNLICHKKFVHATERPYKCKECPKTFALAHFLKRHSLNHRNEKTFKCGFCSKKFKYKSSMDKHIKEVHNEDAGTEIVETFDDVKMEPVMIYDSELKREILYIKDEIEEEMALDVKQESEDVDEIDLMC